MPRKKKRGRLKLRPEVRRAYFDRDGWLCQYCLDPLGDDPQNRTLDHVQPFHHGGPEAGNLVACCKRCNSAKGKLWLDAFCREHYVRQEAWVIRRQAKTTPTVQWGH